jgi:hypothetical protein
MKHLGFTLQFIVLLVAIPLLMFAEFSRNDSQEPVETTGSQIEMNYSEEPSGKPDPLLPSVSLFLN